MEDLIAIAEKFGVPVAILVYFIIRDIFNSKQAIKRETKMIERIGTIEDYQREKLAGLVTASTEAITNNTRSTERLHSILAVRPCIKKDMEFINSAGGAE